MGLKKVFRNIFGIFFFFSVFLFLFKFLDGLVVPRACLSTVPASMGQRKKGTTYVVIEVCIIGGHLDRGGHPGHTG